MRIAVICGDNVGHSLELAPLIFKDLSNFIPYVDTITSFPERFSVQQDSLVKHFYVNQLDFSGKKRNLSDIYIDICRILESCHVYDFLLFLTIDELFNLSELAINRLVGVTKRSKLVGIYYSSSYWRIDEKRSWCVFREKKIERLNFYAIFTPDYRVACLSKNGLTNFYMQWLPDATSIIQSEKKSTNILFDLIDEKKKGKRVVGLIGSLGKWKGLLQLLQALDENKSLLDKYLFVISGQIVRSTFSDDELDFLDRVIENINSNILYHPYNLDDNNDFNRLCSMCDYLYCFYNNPQSSGILSKAILANKRVLGVNQHYIGDMMKAFPFLGESVKEINGSTLECALKNLDNTGIDFSNEGILALQRVYSISTMVSGILMSILGYDNVFLDDNFFDFFSDENVNYKYLDFVKNRLDCIS